MSKCFPQVGSGKTDLWNARSVFYSRWSVGSSVFSLKVLALMSCMAAGSSVDECRYPLGRYLSFR